MPHLIVIAGPNGAGKSTLAPKLLADHLQIQQYVNADTIAQGLCAFRPEKEAFAAGRMWMFDNSASEGSDLIASMQNDIISIENQEKWCVIERQTSL